MASKSEVQAEVRRRDRFQCQYCARKGEQYAHIVPESDGGDYILENLIFLCYECHNTWQEPSRTPPEMKAKLIDISQKLRDREKTDNILSSIFAWPAGEKPAVVFGGGIKVVNQERILERKGDRSRPYLKLSVDDIGLIHIDAYFDDAEGNDFMHVMDNVLKVHTAAAWDVVFTRRSIRFEHIDQKMRLEIQQKDNMDLYVTGNLYLNGGYYVITDDRLVDTAFNNVLSNCEANHNGYGLLLVPGTIIF